MVAHPFQADLNYIEIFRTLSQEGERGRKGVGEMAQQLRTVAAFPESLSSIPSTNMVTHIYL